MASVTSPAAASMASSCAVRTCSSAVRAMLAYAGSGTDPPGMLTVLAGLYGGLDGGLDDDLAAARGDRTGIGLVAGLRVTGGQVAEVAVRIAEDHDVPYLVWRCGTDRFA